MDQSPPPPSSPPPSSSPSSSSPWDPGDRPLASTEAAVTAVREIVERFGLEMAVEHAIGADESSRRTAAGAFTVTDEDGALPHEALVDIPATDHPSGTPATPKIQVQLFEEGDAHLSVDGVTFHDLPREAVPAFLEAVFGGRARVKRTWYPPFCRLVVALPGDRTYKEIVPMAYGGLSRWMRTRDTASAS